jgi:hypothetical protein
MILQKILIGSGPFVHPAERVVLNEISTNDADILSLVSINRNHSRSVRKFIEYLGIITFI